MDFYLTLPSNSSMEYFADNTLSRYVTRLPQAIDLEGDWEMGLVEIQYPHTWYNVGSEDTRMVVLTMDEDGNYAAQKRLYLNAGFYPSIRDLIDAINHKVRKVTKDRAVQLKYDEIKQKVTILLDERTLLMMQPGMQDILGLDTITIRQTTKARKVVDMNRGFYSMYAYTDIAEPRVVGDHHASLLRIVPITGKDGEFVTRSYENVQYLSVQKKHFDALEIDIRDDTGRPVPFERGKVVVTLHFRKRHLSRFL